MGWASCVEDMVDRFNEAVGLLMPYTSRPTTSSGCGASSMSPPTSYDDRATSQDDQRDKLLQDLRRAASEFLTTHGELHRRAGLTAGEWGRHFDDLKDLHDILLPVGYLEETQPEARSVL